MAWTNSKVSAAFAAAAWDRSQAFDLDTDAFKCVLFNNSVTPDGAAAAAAYGYNLGTWVTANEVSDGVEWDAGGEPILNPVISVATTTVKWAADDTVSGGTSATLADVFGCLNIDDTLTSPVADPGVCHNYFGGANGVTAGVFTVVWSASGIMSLSVA